MVMTGTVLLIFDVADGLTVGTAAAGSILVVIVLLAILPARRALRAPRHVDHPGRNRQI